MPTHTLQPVLRRGLCAGHSGWSTHEFFNKRMEEFIPQTCAGCREKNPWHQEDHIEVTGFNYERANLEKSLKSPNGGRFNVVFIPLLRYIRLGETKSSRQQVEAWAEAAYEKEMVFSSDRERAEVLKRAVLNNNYLYVDMPLELR
jgi:hypothetical protein